MYVDFLGSEAISLHKNERLDSYWSLLNKIRKFDSSWQLAVSYVDLKVTVKVVLQVYDRWRNHESVDEYTVVHVQANKLIKAQLVYLKPRYA